MFEDMVSNSFEYIYTIKWDFLVSWSEFSIVKMKEKKVLVDWWTQSCDMTDWWLLGESDYWFELHNDLKSKSTLAKGIGFFFQ